METKHVVVGLVLAGAVAGGIASAVAVGAVTMVLGGPPSILRGNEPNLVVMGGKLGATFGAVLGPLAAWLLMRHVPLWVAIGGTMLGTVAGGVAALAMDTHLFTLPLAGFATSALAIRIAVPRRPRLAA